MIVFFCNRCGLRVEAEKRSFFCGDECCKQSRIERAKDRRQERKEEQRRLGPAKRTCLNCGELFTPVRIERICSDRCRNVRAKKFYRRRGVA